MPDFQFMTGNSKVNLPYYRQDPASRLKIQNKKY